MIFLMLAPMLATHYMSCLRLIMYNNVTHMYLPNKRSSLLLHSRIPLIECASEYSESLYSYTVFDLISEYALISELF